MLHGLATKTLTLPCCLGTQNLLTHRARRLPIGKLKANHLHFYETVDNIVSFLTLHPGLTTLKLEMSYTRNERVR